MSDTNYVLAEGKIFWQGVLDGLTQRFELT